MLNFLNELLNRSQPEQQTENPAWLNFMANQQPPIAGQWFPNNPESGQNINPGHGIAGWWNTPNADWGTRGRSILMGIAGALDPDTAQRMSDLQKDRRAALVDQAHQKADLLNRMDEEKARNEALAKEGALNRQGDVERFGTFEQQKTAQTERDKRRQLDDLALEAARNKGEMRVARIRSSAAGEKPYIDQKTLITSYLKAEADGNEKITKIHQEKAAGQYDDTVAAELEAGVRQDTKSELDRISRMISPEVKAAMGISENQEPTQEPTVDWESKYREGITRAGGLAKFKVKWLTDKELRKEFPFDEADFMKYADMVDSTPQQKTGAPPGAYEILYQGGLAPGETLEAPPPTMGSLAAYPPASSQYLNALKGLIPPPTHAPGEDKPFNPYKGMR